MTRRLAAFAIVALAAPWLGAGCGGDDGDGTTAGGGTTGPPGAEGPAAPDAAPLPPLPAPAPALACTGSEVVCVDASSPPGEADGSAERPFTSVADALAAAGPGTVIQVAAGRYEGGVVIEGAEELRLVGGFPAGGDFSGRDPEANETVLVGTAEESVIAVFASSGIHIEGLRLTGGGGYSDGFRVEGGGIFVDGESSGISIVANRIDGNAIDRGDDPDEARGGGISSNGTAVEIIGNVVEGNRGGRGAGIAAVGASTVVDRNTVVGNEGVGDHGGGLYLAGELTVTANHVEGNVIGIDIGYGWGGGIIVFGEGSVATLRGNVVTGNFAPTYGAGVFIDDGARAALVGELYYANECPEEGGAGFFVDSGGPTATVADLDHVTIAEHDCPDAAQGGNAIYAGRSDVDAPQPVVTVSNSILWANGGRDLLVVESDVTVTSTLSEEGIDGEGNLSADPRFTDPASGDFSLGPQSPAIGAGTDGTDLGFTGAGS